MELTPDILKQLAEPFPPKAISIKVQTKPNENMQSLCVAYIDARDVMDRLDAVVGGEWSDVYSKAPSGGLECALTVCGVTRRDVGEDDNDNEKEKAGYSDAFKRAAVKFGIGRFLYSMPKMFAKVKQVGKNAYLADGEEVRLQGVIAAHLAGKPAPATSKPAPSVKSPQSPAPAKKEEVTLPKVANEIITDSEWATFDALRLQVIKENPALKLPEYDRSKMRPADLNNVTKYFHSKLEKAGK